MTTDAPHEGQPFANVAAGREVTDEEIERLAETIWDAGVTCGLFLFRPWWDVNDTYRERCRHVAREVVRRHAARSALAEVLSILSAAMPSPLAGSAMEQAEAVADWIAELEKLVRQAPGPIRVRFLNGGYTHKSAGALEKWVPRVGERIRRIADADVTGFNDSLGFESVVTEVRDGVVHGEKWEFLLEWIEPAPPASPAPGCIPHDDSSRICNAGTLGCMQSHSPPASPAAEATKAEGRGGLRECPVRAELLHLWRSRPSEDDAEGRALAWLIDARAHDAARIDGIFELVKDCMERLAALETSRVVEKKA